MYNCSEENPCYGRVNAILDAAAFKNGTIKLRREEVDMDRVAAQVFENLHLLKKPGVMLWKQVFANT